MYPPRDLPHALERRLEALGDPLEPLPWGVELRRDLCLGRFDLEGEPQELLLHPVMQIALDVPTSLVGCGNDPPP
jgi:hypothetical protein